MAKQQWKTPASEAHYLADLIGRLLGDYIVLEATQEEKEASRAIKAFYDRLNMKDEFIQEDADGLRNKYNALRRKLNAIHKESKSKS